MQAAIVDAMGNVSLPYPKNPEYAVRDPGRLCGGLSRKVRQKMPTTEDSGDHAGGECIGPRAQAAAYRETLWRGQAVDA